MSSSPLARARDFLLTHARPLERAAFQCHRHPNSESLGALLRELKGFQNPDGGFGHALEPDYRAENSSVIATNIALCHLYEALRGVENLAVSGLDETIDAALNWLVSVYDTERRVWPIVPGTGENEPHAPWWNTDQLDEAFSGFALNPTAETAGWLVRFGKSSVKELGLSLASVLLERLEDPSLATSAGALPCLLRLCRIEGYTADFRQRLKLRTAELVASQVERSEALWTGYCIKPHQAMPVPSGPGAESDLVRRGLEWEGTRQSADGSFAPHWSWFGAYPDSWPQAEQDARSILTLETLMALEAWRV